MAEPDGYPAQASWLCPVPELLDRAASAGVNTGGENPPRFEQRWAQGRRSGSLFTELCTLFAGRRSPPAPWCRPAVGASPSPGPALLRLSSPAAGRGDRPGAGGELRLRSRRPGGSLSLPESPGRPNRSVSTASVMIKTKLHCRFAAGSLSYANEPSIPFCRVGRTGTEAQRENLSPGARSPDYQLQMKDYKYISESSSRHANMRAPR